MKYNCIFGDSFTEPFKLLPHKNKNINKDRIYKSTDNDKKNYLNNFINNLYEFHGKTMKGITKEKNIVRECILDTVNKLNKKINVMLFLFGWVDCNESYYYDIFIKKVKFYPNDYIEKYVKFIKELNIEDNKKVIILPLPNAAGEKEFYMRARYFNKTVPKLSKSQQYYYFSIKNREKRRQKFNNILKYYCKLYKVKYLDFDKQLFDKKGCLKDKFKIVSRNHHLVWEYSLEMMTKKLKQYGFEQYKPPKKVEFSIS